MLTTTGMSAPPMGMMMSTPMTKASASMAKKAGQLSLKAKARPRPSRARPSTRFTGCWPAKVTGAPWKRRNLYLPLSLPKAITEPLKVTAPMAAPRKSSKRLPVGMGRPLATMPKAQGSATAATAMNTAARPIMLCMKATSSGIFVISTRCAMRVPAPPPTASPTRTQTMPCQCVWPLKSENCTISAPVVTTATAIPAMPKRLPRIEVVGWLSPLSAWMKHTLATR